MSQQYFSKLSGHGEVVTLIKLAHPSHVNGISLVHKSKFWSLNQSVTWTGGNPTTKNEENQVN